MSGEKKRKKNQKTYNQFAVLVIIHLWRDKTLGVATVAGA